MSLFGGTHRNLNNVALDRPSYLLLVFQRRLTPQPHVCRMRCLPSHILVSVSREDSKVQSLGTPFLSTDSECASFGCVYGSGSPDWLARKKLPRVHMALPQIQSSPFQLFSVWWMARPQEVCACSLWKFLLFGVLLRLVDDKPL